MLNMTAAKVSGLVGGTLSGDPDRVLSDVASLDDAQGQHITYVASEMQLGKLAGSHAGAILVPVALVPRLPSGITPTVIAVADAQAAFVDVMLRFRPLPKRPQIGISSQAYVSASAKFGEGCNVYPGASIGDGATLGQDCDIHPGAVVGPGCRLGDNVVIHANAVLYHDVQLGNRVIVHASAVIGADGFGYRMVEGRFVHLPHTGTVILEDDVEIGSCTTVDRAMIGATVVGEGTKIDNQVMIAHNCRLGKHNAFAGQVGFAGSVTTGDYVRCGGQAGVANHSHIGTGASLGAMSGVSGVVPDGARYHGVPAGPEKDALKIYTSLKKLPEMRLQLRELEATVKKLRAELASRDEPASPEQRAA